MLPSGTVCVMPCHRQGLLDDSASATTRSGDGSAGAGEGSATLQAPERGPPETQPTQRAILGRPRSSSRREKVRGMALSGGSKRGVVQTSRKQARLALLAATATSRHWHRRWR